jgi:dTDP-L-rhamnose 4-epimerase
MSSRSKGNESEETGRLLRFSAAIFLVGGQADGDADPNDGHTSGRQVKAKRVLITGGAGFVGSHTADALLRQGHEVRVFDNLSPQVHPRGLPSYLSKEVEFIHGDVRGLSQLSAAVRGIDVIYHLAAAVGVGQSMYRIADYTAVNNLGTANLLQAILDTHSHPEKIVLASSMSIYGEGRSLCPRCGEVAPGFRPLQQLREKRWEATCPQCAQPVRPAATPEDKALQCTSIYALSKKDQEEMLLLFGRTYEIPVVALRYFNIYGTRQSLSNPYTGVAAIFASRLMNGNSPLLFEDGCQMRDFVSVHDTVQANLLAAASSAADGKALNVGSGQPVTIREIAAELGRALGLSVPVDITEKYRAGDIRHCFGDISAISALLHYRPQVRLKNGIEELVLWLQSQQAEDHVLEAVERLNVRGLVA